MFRTLALTGTAAATLALGGLTPDRSADVETRFGAPVAVGNGTVRTYLTTDNGAPLELGIALSEGVMTGLHGNDHSVPGAVAMPDGHAMFEYTLALPQENPTPYRHVVLINSTGCPVNGAASCQSLASFLRPRARCPKRCLQEPRRRRLSTH